MEAGDLRGAEFLAYGFDSARPRSGKDRLVLFLSPDRVLKAARHENGRLANAAEAALWANAPASWARWVMPVFAADPGGRWVIAGRSEGAPSPRGAAAVAAMGEDGRARHPMPRAMALHVEHPWEVDQWGRWRGRDVLLDYAPGLGSVERTF